VNNESLAEEGAASTTDPIESLAELFEAEIPDKTRLLPVVTMAS